MIDIPKNYASLTEGAIKVHHTGTGPYPVLVPTTGILLKVNGVEQHKEVAVKETDEIFVAAVDEVVPGSWSIWISPNLLAAYVRLQPGKKIRRSLPNIAPTERLTIVPLEAAEPFPAVALGELTARLGQEGLLPRADMSLLPLVTQALEVGQYLIASGTPPTPGRDAEIAMFFETAQRTEKNVNDDSAVDFRSRYEFTAVKEGQILVKKTLPVAGIPGLGVRGEQILPPPPKDMELLAGSGVMHQEWAQQLVATRAGRPVLRPGTQSIAVDVVPDMLVKGSVDLKSGSISFLGDVSVGEDVTAGFSVWAGGMLRIGGVVEKAQAQAVAGINVRGNITASQVQVGPPLDFLRNVRSLLPSLKEEINALSLAVQQLKKRMPPEKEKFAAQLVSAMLNQRGEEFESKVKQLHEELRHLDHRLLEMYGSSLVGTVGTYRQEIEQGKRTEEQLAGMARLAVVLAEKIAVINPEEAHLAAGNIISSQVSCTGSLTITGGIYNSKVQAGGKILVQGVFRGGEMKAGGDVAVKELGSEASVATSITVPTNAKVSVGVGWENCYVIIGPRRYKFEKKQIGVTIRLEEGNILVR